MRFTFIEFRSMLLQKQETELLTILNNHILSSPVPHRKKKWTPFNKFSKLVISHLFVEKPESIEPEEGQVLCEVCSDIANGVHFGVPTCEGCKVCIAYEISEYTELQQLKLPFCINNVTKPITTFTSLIPT